MTDCQNAGTLDVVFDAAGNAGPPNDPRVNSFTVPVLDIFSGTLEQFPSQLVGDERASSGGFYSYAPFDYDDGLSILTDAVSRYVQWTYHRYSGSGTRAANDARLMRFRAALEQPVEARGSAAELVLPAGGRTALLDGGSGLPPAGLVTELRIALACGDANQYGVPNLDRVMLTLTVDGADEPQVSVPISHYFGGVPHGEPVTSLVVETARESGRIHLTSRLPIPYASSITLEAENLGGEDLLITADATVVSSAEMPALIDDGIVGRLHAAFTSGATVDDEDMPLARIDGSGHLAGVVLRLSSNDPDQRRILEGDDRIFVDGQISPSIHGTGTEDFFNGGWYYKFGPFSAPWHGNPAHFVDESGDHTTQFRFFVSDFVPFTQDIRVGMEHGPRNDEAGTFAATTFWYGSRASRSVPVEVHAGSPTGRESRTLRVLGAPAAGQISRSGRTIAPGDEMHLRVDLPPGTEYVMLRRVVDAAVGNQEVRVFLADRELPAWYTPGFSPDSAFSETEYLIDGDVVRGNGTVTIMLTAEAEWNEYGFTAFAAVDNTEDRE
jgi:hypothetical protein